MAISKHDVPYSTAVASNATAGILNFAKHARSPANMQQNDGRPGVGNFVAEVPTDTTLKLGDVIVVSDVQNASMSVFGFSVRIAGVLGTAAKVRPAIIRYPDPAATPAARAAAADKSILHWLSDELTPVAAGVGASLSGTEPVAKTIAAAVASADTAGNAPLWGYPIDCNFFLGLVVTAKATAATAAAVEVHSHYQYAVQTQREV